MKKKILSIRTLYWTDLCCFTKTRTSSIKTKHRMLGIFSRFSFHNSDINVWKIRLSQKTRLYRPILKIDKWLSFSSSIFDWRVENILYPFQCWICVLWRTKYIKTRFRPGLLPEPRWRLGSLRRFPDPLVGSGRSARSVLIPSHHDALGVSISAPRSAPISAPRFSAANTNSWLRLWLA